MHSCWSHLSGHSGRACICEAERNLSPGGNYLQSQKWITSMKHPIICCVRKRKAERANKWGKVLDFGFSSSSFTSSNCSLKYGPGESWLSPGDDCNRLLTAIEDAPTFYFCLNKWWRQQRWSVCDTQCSGEPSRPHDSTGDTFWIL